MRRARFVAAAFCAVAACAAVPAWADGPTTADETILDLNGDNRLELAKGECHIVRYLDGGTAPCRKKPPKGRTALLHFGQLTDTHMLDAEAPRIIEDIEAGLGALFADAYRPQQELEGQVVGAMTERLNGIRSPVEGAKMDNYIVTGDNTDNIQYNETLNYLAALNGGIVEPDSGDPTLKCEGKPPPQDAYQGVVGDPFYSADDANDGRGYSDDEKLNFATRRRHVALRDFPGLFPASRAAFTSAGLGTRWYTAFGNHDSTEQGTLVGPTSPAAFAAISAAQAGCHKWLPGDRWLGTTRTLAILIGDILPTLPDGPLPTFPRPGDPKDSCFPLLYLEPCSVVARDPDRRMLDPQEWIDLHFGGGEPLGHGFADRDTPDATYYSTSPAKGIRYIGIDTVNHDFFSNGALSDEQFDWLDAKLTAADRKHELTIVFGHHTIATIDNICDIRPIEPRYHLGPRGARGSCFVAALANPNPVGESVEELLARHRSVVAYVAGHEHRNAIRPHQVGKDAFWEISTAAHIDWPQQSRLIDIEDNCDKTLSLFGTLVDQAGPADSGDKPPLDDPLVLASISREHGFNDWQGRNGEDGTRDNRGAPIDRNVELITPNPYKPIC